MNSNGSITDLTAYANDIIIVETKTFYYQTTTIIIFRTIENGLHWDGHWTKCLLKLLKIRHFVSNDFLCKQYSHTHTSIRTSTVCLCRHTCRFLSWVTRDDVEEKKRVLMALLFIISHFENFQFRFHSYHSSATVTSFDKIMDFLLTDRENVTKSNLDGNSGDDGIRKKEEGKKTHTLYGTMGQTLRIFKK